MVLVAAWGIQQPVDPATSCLERWLVGRASSEARSCGPQHISGGCHPSAWSCGYGAFACACLAASYAPACAGIGLLLGDSPTGCSPAIPCLSDWDHPRFSWWSPAWVDGLSLCACVCWGREPEAIFVTRAVFSDVDRLRVCRCRSRRHQLGCGVALVLGANRSPASFFSGNTIGGSFPGRRLGLCPPAQGLSCCGRVRVGAGLQLARATTHRRWLSSCACLIKQTLAWGRTCWQAED